MGIIRRTAVLAVIIASAALASCARHDSRTAMMPPPPGAGLPPTADAAAQPPHVASAPIDAPIAQPKLKPSDLIGRWGFGSYHRHEDRERTIAVASKQCDKPYLIGEGPTGGVVMYLPDNKEPSELRIKAGSEGYDMIGPEGPAGGSLDREVTSIDGPVVTMRYISPEIAGRYGTAVFVRCDADMPAEPTTPKAKAKTKPKASTAPVAVAPADAVAKPAHAIVKQAKAEKPVKVAKRQKPAKTAKSAAIRKPKTKAAATTRPLTAADSLLSSDTTVMAAPPPAQPAVASEQR